MIGINFLNKIPFKNKVKKLQLKVVYQNTPGMCRTDNATPSSPHSPPVNRRKSRPPLRKAFSGKSVTDGFPVSAREEGTSLDYSALAT